MTINLAPAWE